MYLSAVQIDTNLQSRYVLAMWPGTCYGDLMKTPVPSVPLPHQESALSNELCRRAFRLPTMQARLLHVILSQIRYEKGQKQPVPLKVTMRVSDILRVLELHNSGRARPLMLEAIRKLAEYRIVESPDKAASFYGFIDEAHEDEENTIFTFHIGHTISKHVGHMKELFTLFENREIRRLNGDHAIRFFQILSSWKSMKGLNGNPSGCWFCVMSIEDIRHKLCVDADDYVKRDGTANFKKKVIETPIAEINRKGVGFTVETTYNRVGRRLVSVRFDCKEDLYAAARNQSPETPA